MKILVYNVAAESGGALSVLKDFYHEVQQEENDDSWYFVVSKVDLNEKNNIHILKYEWIKKSWFHRIYFDYIIAPKIVKKYGIDKIISLQNTTVPRTSLKQVLYLHNSLPFVEYKFKYKENKLMWVYQNVIGKVIKNSCKNSDKIIVQTNWMKKACIDEIKIKQDKIHVIPPKINLKVKNHFIPDKECLRTFFYPASGVVFKNHEVIINACRLLKKEKINNYEVMFTLQGNENEHIKRLYQIVENEKLPIKFIGSISRDEVYEMYSRSILIFPSYIESSPLPLSEGKIHKTLILASNCNFSKEVLEEYPNKYYFQPFCEEELKCLMKKSIFEEIEYSNFIEKQNKSTDSWKNVLKIIKEI